jgi:hypothetical protein
MNAANITHGLKLAGGNTRMSVGVLVIAIVICNHTPLTGERGEQTAY